MPKPNPRRGRTKLHKMTAQTARPPADNGKAPAPLGGRLASEVESRAVEWLLYPWIPKGLLSMVVGNPCVGTSCFIADLDAHATGGPNMEMLVKNRAGKVVMLPGYEEDLEVMTVPRMKAAGCLMARVKLLTEERISLDRHKEALAREVKSFGASLLVGDPVDSYIGDDFDENKNVAVRPVLEAAAWIARETGAAVCFARHPGKHIGNVMPGSRAWRAVPREIIQLVTDGNVPPDFILSHFKDSLGTGECPRRYDLKRKGGEPPVFLLGGDVDQTAEDLSRTAGGPVGRYKLMTACRLIRYVFDEDARPTRHHLGEEGRKQGLGEDTVNDALRLLGVRSVPPQRRGDPWQLARTSMEWPAWLPDESTPS